MTLALRHAEEADYAPIIAALDAWWGGRPMTAMLPRLWFIHFRPTSFIAEDVTQSERHLAGFLVGFQSETDPAQAYIHFVGVAPAYRGAGAGRLLYERFFTAARERGCTAVECVTAPVNQGSIAFHRRMGFALLPGDAEEGGIPVVTNYDGLGGARVRFHRAL